MRLEEASNGVTSEVGAVGDEGIQDGLQDAVRFVWNLLTDERNPAPQIEIINENPFPAVMAAEDEGISREDFLEAIDRIAIGLDDSRAAELQTLRETIANSSAPDVTHLTRRNVTQVFETNNVQVSRTTDNRVENTNVDNRVVTEINARGDVDFDLAVENETVIADDGAVAVGGNVEESAINTGVNTGVIAGDDVGLSDSIIGDDNLQANLTAAPAPASEAEIEEAPLEEAPQDEPVIEQPVFEDESFEDDLDL